MKVIYAILLAMFTATAYAQTEISSFQLGGDSIRIENSIITHSNTSGDLFPRHTKSILIFSLLFKELISSIVLWFTLWFTIFVLSLLGLCTELTLQNYENLSERLSY